MIIIFEWYNQIQHGLMNMNILIFFYKFSYNRRLVINYYIYNYWPRRESS